MTREQELSAKILEANQAYYNNDEPIMSDQEYDALKDELKSLNEKHPTLFEVGADVEKESNKWEKEEHKIPMSSLDKVNTIPELEKWAVGKGVVEFCTQEKLDGISLSLNYEQGELVSAITRGNGLIGENITPNARQMQGVPHKLPTAFTGSVRGEVILHKDDWEKHFPDTSNPRNAASGLARRVSGGGQEHLRVLCYDIASTNQTFMTEGEVFDYLEYLGFTLPAYWVSDLKKVAEVYDEYGRTKRAALPYEIDGLVIKVNDVIAQRALGRHGDRSNANPKGQVALKFAHEMRATKMCDPQVTWEVGLTGRVTPLAHFEPVRVAGANIAKASLHNISNIEKLGLKLDSEILVSRRNDVIPFVEEVIKAGAADIVIPTECPKCDTTLDRQGEYLQCPNEECKAAGNIEKWIKLFEVDDIGPKLIAQLVEAELVETPADLYRLTVDDLLKLERMGEKSAKKIVKHLQAAKQAPLNVFLGALNIQSCGRRVFETVMKAGFDTLDKVRTAHHVQLANIDGLGSKTSAAIVSGLKRKSDLIDDLLQVGVEIVKVQKGDKLSGESFCFSGKSNLGRKELEAMVKNNGGEVRSVSKELKYLVLADPNSTSSKANKARKLGVQIISEDAFIEMLK